MTCPVCEKEHEAFCCVWCKEQPESRGEGCVTHFCDAEEIYSVGVSI